MLSSSKVPQPEFRVLMAEHPLRSEQGRVLRKVFAVHQQVLPVHVDLDVVQPLGPELVDHVQRHADVAHEDLQRRFRVLVLEEEQDPALPATLGRLADSLDEPGPTFHVGRLKRVVVSPRSRAR